MDKKNPENISVVEMLSYGGAQFALSIYTAFSTYYLMMFCTDVALIPPAATGALLLCYRLVSVADDPIMGLSINRVRFKEGKYRPYFKWLALPFALGLAAFGLTPGIDPAARVFLAAFTLILCELSRSAMSTASLSMLPYFAKDDATRTKFVSFSNGSAIVSYIAIGTFMLPLAGFLGRGDRSKGFTLTLILFAAIALPLLLNAWFRLKERHYGETPGKPSLGDLVLAIVSNKRFLMFLIGFFLYAMANSFKNQIGYYYVTYNLENPDLLPIVNFAGLISSLAMQPVIPRLLAYAKKESLIIFGVFASSIASLMMLAAGSNPVALIVCFVFYGLFTAIVANLTFAVIASFTDEIRLRRNMNMSEILTASMGLSSNLGLTITSVLAPLAMEMSGYSAEASSQAPAALAGFKILFILCTALGLALSGLVFSATFRKRPRQETTA